MISKELQKCLEDARAESCRKTAEIVKAQWEAHERYTLIHEKEYLED